MVGNTTADEEQNETVEINAESAEVARRELELLIEETEGEEPDPLTDDVFRALSDISESLEEVED